MTGQLGFSGAGDLVTGNLGTRYSERPTISFSLLGGEAFQRRMLQPIELVALEDSDYDPFEPDKTMDEIALDTRSLIGVLYYLSHGIEAASEDVEAEVITSTVMGGGELFEWTELLDGLFRVESSDGVPERAAVAARHRGRWFYIDDSDQSSKSTFNLLSQLFTLQAGEVEAVKPVLTLPVGAP